MSSRVLTARHGRLVTERLLLEPLAPTHASEMALVLADPGLHRYVGGQPLPLEQLQERYEHQARRRSDDGSERWFNWIVRDRVCGAALGYVQATVTVESGVATLAWVIGSRFQGRGYGREATAAMVSWLRGIGVTTIRAHIHPGHRASEGRRRRDRTRSHVDRRGRRGAMGDRSNLT